MTMDLPIDILEKVDIATLLAIAAMLWFFYSRLDKKFTQIDDKFKEVSETINRNEAKFSARLDMKIDPIEKDLIQINTRIAVIESRLSDIGSNLSHLMWHQQALPQKEAEEQ